ncbi:hypothetical protein EV368DRAFT_77922 [Lentinula lateritia]|nr:hypothetical protein EV368DRAFT_77922 [Lentinula lateritia]
MSQLVTTGIMFTIIIFTALFTSVTTTLKGDDYDTWTSEMKAFLQASGLGSVIITNRPEEPSLLNLQRWAIAASRHGIYESEI